MLQVQRPEDAFQSVPSWKPNIRAPPSPPHVSKYNRPCRYGADCAFLEMGECFYNHDSTPLSARLVLMEEELTNPVMLPAFRGVDPFQWYGIQNVETLASFNVLKDGRLAVPGLPPMLRRPTSDMFFKTPDSELPSSPAPQTPKFDPLIRALQILQPDLDTSSLAIVTTAGCLRRIAAFFTHSPRAHRLDIELRDGTLFMGRWEGDALLHKFFGYGKQFEEGVRRHAPWLGGSESSHLVVGYEMGGLRMGVQIEVDAFDCKCHSHARLLSTRETPRAKKRLLGGRFDVLSDASDEDPADEEDDGVLKVGTQLPLSCAVEIKTRTRDSAADYPYLPQLYFQQISRVFFAVRDGNRFRTGSMGMRDERRALRAWEAENQALLGKVVALLKWVRKEAERRGDGCKMVLVFRGHGGGAVLYERDGGRLVSDV